MNSDIITFAAFFAAVFYIVSAVTLTGRFLHSDGPKEMLSRVVAAFATLVHLGIIYLSISATDGQNMSMTNVLSLVAWLMTVSMLISSLYLRNIILLPVVFGFSAIALLLGVAVPDHYATNIGLNSGLVIHVTLSLFAYGTLMIGLLYAIQVNFITGQLKEKKTAILHSSLPPLMTVESILVKLLSAGTVMLLIAITSGAIFLNNLMDSQHAHKTVLTLLALLVYCVALIGNRLWGWRGKPMLLAAIAGSFLLTLAYFGSRFVREVIL